MANLAFPLKLDGAFLSRTDKTDAVLQLLRLMAQTPHGSWKGSKHFGLRNLIQDSGGRSGGPRAAVIEINRSLEDLGIDDWKVVSIDKESAPGAETASYSLTVQRTDDDGTPMRFAF